MKTKTSLLIAVACLVLCNFSAFAAAKKEYKMGGGGFEWYLITENGKHGAQDKNGNILVPVEFKEVKLDTYFSEPQFIVTTFSGAKGLYTVTGRCLVPVSKGYTEVLAVGHEYDPDNTLYIRCLKEVDGKRCLCALCNYKGEEVWHPKKRYNCILPKYVNNRLVFFAVSYEDKKWGVIDKDENVIVPLIYDSPFTLSEKNNEYIFKIRIDGNEVEVGKLNKISRCDNIFPQISFNKLPVTSSTGSPTQKVTLNSMIGKHYAMEAFVLGDHTLPLEGDLAIDKSGMMICLGDGEGAVDEILIYMLEEKINDSKWKISSDSGKGFVEILDQNAKGILIEVKVGNIDNIYILKNQPYDKLTLKL